MFPKPILVYSRDPHLLETRSLVLEQAGFRVFRAMRLTEAEELALTGSVSVLVLCHTVSTQERQDVLAAVERRIPGVRRLVMTAGAWELPLTGQDETLSAYDGPRRLIDAITRLAKSDDA